MHQIPHLFITKENDQSDGRKNRKIYISVEKTSNPPTKVEECNVNLNLARHLGVETVQLPRMDVYYAGIGSLVVRSLGQTTKVCVHIGNQSTQRVREEYYINWILVIHPTEANSDYDDDDGCVESENDEEM